MYLEANSAGIVTRSRISSSAIRVALCHACSASSSSGRATCAGSDVLEAVVADESVSVTTGAAVAVGDAEVASATATSPDGGFEEGSDMLGSGDLCWVQVASLKEMRAKVHTCKGVVAIELVGHRHTRMNSSPSRPCTD